MFFILLFSTEHVFEQPGKFVSLLLFVCAHGERGAYFRLMIWVVPLQQLHSWHCIASSCLSHGVSGWVIRRK